MIVRNLFRLFSLVCAFLAFDALYARGGGLYPHVEASFELPNLSTDPFDYLASDVRVQIMQPDNTTISLPAFYDGGQTWRVRHSPALPGRYQIVGITLNGQAASATNLQPGSWQVSGWPSSPGFLGIDPSNPTRFVTGDSRRFFPLGHDVAWDVNSKTNVVSILSKLGAADENWARIWMDHWDGKNLDWPSAGALGTLNLTVARKWDAIVSAADQAGVHFQMTLHHHGQYSSTVDPNWPQNPYNVANGGFLSDATQFFTNATAKALTKRKLRYAIARWGYSPAVMAWELFNEVQFTDAAQNGQWTNVASWHNEMAQFIRAQDPYHHLVTTSSQLDQQIWDECDYYQHHDYPNDLISALRDPQGVPSGQPVKPIFAGECGIEDTPLLGVQGPLWAGLMAGQSGAAQQWYWDRVDADNAYRLFKSAQQFVLLSGLGDQDIVYKSAPHVTCPVNSALVFSPGGGWASAVQTTFTVGDSAPVGIGTLPSFLQGGYHRTQMNMPNGYTFLVNYEQAGTFSVQVIQIAASGASVVMTVDSLATNRIDWPAPGADTATNFTLTVNIPAGAHTIRLTNPGADWVNLGDVTLNPYTPILGAYQLWNTNFAAVWIWHRTNIYNPSASATVAGTFPLTGLSAGNYRGTWWDTFAGASITNFGFDADGSNAVAITIPPVLRSAAFFAGPPAKAAVTAPSLIQTVASNSAPLNMPIIITNAGGLPLAYSISITGAAPVIYRATDSTQPGGPVFAWKDISAVGRDITPDFTGSSGLPARDEGIAGPIDIGFPFPFFSGGQAPDLFTQLYVSPNGFVTFAPFAGVTRANQPLPSSLAPTNSIAFFWCDLDLTAAGHVYCATDELSGAFVLQFQDAPIYGTSTALTCQLILKTSGEILMQYKSIGNPSGYTVGIQDSAALHGLQVSYNQTYLQDGLALRLSPAPWLSISKNAGLVPRWSDEALTAVLDPAGVSSGTYSAHVSLRTSDPMLPLIQLPVSLTVLAPFDAWRLAHFGTTENTGASADDADPDHDGLVNIIEYALGLDPNLPDPEPIAPYVEGGHLVFAYRRPHPAPPDIVYTPEVTGNLSTPIWDSGPAYASQAVVDNGDGTETVTVTDLANLSSSSVHFLRLRISR